MAESKLEDNLLIKRYLDGDEEAFAILYEKYKKVLYSFYLKSLSGDGALADDLFQQTWVKVIKALPKYKDQQTFLAWLMMIGRNTMLDHFRKVNRKKESELDDSYMGEAKVELPSQKMGRNELEQKVEEVLDSLPSEQREVYLLRQSGVSFKDIAVMQDVTLNTALGRMHYAVTKLKKTLKDWI